MSGFCGNPYPIAIPALEHLARDSRRIADHMTTMQVSEIMSRDVKSVGPNDQLEAVAREKDLLKIFYEPNAHCVESVMTRDPISMSVEEQLVDVVDCLMANDFRHVLSHEHQNLVGLVTRADLMPAILKALLEGC